MYKQLSDMYIYDIHKYTLTRATGLFSFTLGEHLGVIWKICTLIHIEVVYFNFEIKSNLWSQQKLFYQNT